MAEIDIQISGVGDSKPVTEPLRAILLKSAEELELSVRGYNCLKNNGIETLVDLVTLSEYEFLRLKNSGRKNLNELKEVLPPLGVAFGTKFYDHSSGRELSRDEVRVAMKNTQLEFGWEDPQKDISHGLSEELAHLFKKAGRNAVTWPIPEEVQVEATQRLRAMRMALDGYGKQ